MRDLAHLFAPKFYAEIALDTALAFVQDETYLNRFPQTKQHIKGLCWLVVMFAQSFGVAKNEMEYIGTMEYTFTDVEQYNPFARNGTPLSSKVKEIVERLLKYDKERYG